MICKQQQQPLRLNYECICLFRCLIFVASILVSRRIVMRFVFSENRWHFIVHLSGISLPCSSFLFSVSRPWAFRVSVNVQPNRRQRGECVALEIDCSESRVEVVASPPSISVRKNCWNSIEMSASNVQAAFDFWALSFQQLERDGRSENGSATHQTLSNTQIEYKQHTETEH